MEILAEWHFSPSLEQAREIREALTQALDQFAVPRQQDFLLACSELIVNLCRYPQPKPEQAILRLSKDRQDWWLELLDDGGTFREFSQHIHSEAPLEAAESGMGLKLLATLFRDLSYVPGCYRDDGMNLMSLRQSLVGDAEIKQTIVVVDDDPSYRAVLNSYLQKSYQVIPAGSVKEGFEQVLRYKPDLVVCDIRMPDADGSALFDQLSHIPEVAATAFIYISGCESDELISRALQRPIDDFIRKPVDKAGLLATVSRVMARRHHLADHIEHELYERVTLGLQPRLPAIIGNYRVAVRNRAPDAGGGDLVLTKGNLLVVADLMGHGLQAKGFSYALAGYLRGLCAALAIAEQEPEALLMSVAEGFNDDPVLSNTLATIQVIGLLPGGVLRIANAGHPMPVVIDSESASEFKVSGALPGMQTSDYQSRDLQLQVGQRVVLLSDGMLDKVGKMPVAVQDMLTSLADDPLEQAADKLFAVATTENSVVDDQTFILIEPADSDILA